MDIRERIMHIIFSALQIANPELANCQPTEQQEKQIIAEVRRIYKGVQGNKPPGSNMPLADQFLMLENALRRAVEIIDEAQKEVRS